MSAESIAQSVLVAGVDHARRVLHRAAASMKKSWMTEASAAAGALLPRHQGRSTFATPGGLRDPGGAGAGVMEFCDSWLHR